MPPRELLLIASSVFTFYSNFLTKQCFEHDEMCKTNLPVYTIIMPVKVFCKPSGQGISVLINLSAKMEKKFHKHNIINQIVSLFLKFVLIFRSISITMSLNVINIMTSVKK